MCSFYQWCFMLPNKDISFLNALNEMLGVDKSDSVHV